MGRRLDLALLIVYGLSVPALFFFGLFALAGVSLGILLSLGPSPNVHVVEPSPDRELALVTTWNFGGGPTSTAPLGVKLVGDSFDEKASIGGYPEWVWELTDGWRGPRTANVCRLRSELDGGRAVVTLKRRERAPVDVLITTECPQPQSGGGVSDE
jgi:hypothetical protein